MSSLPVGELTATSLIVEEVKKTRRYKRQRKYYFVRDFSISVMLSTMEELLYRWIRTDCFEVESK